MGNKERDPLKSAVLLYCNPTPCIDMSNSLFRSESFEMVLEAFCADQISWGIEKVATNANDN